MRIFSFLFFLCSINFTPAVVFLTDRDMESGAALAKTPLFSPVGCVLVEDECGTCAGTATLLGPQSVLTAKHNLRTYDEKDNPRGPISLVKPDRVHFYWRSKKHDIQEIIPCNGKDLVLLILKNLIPDDAIYPVIDIKNPENLKKLIWDSIPSFHSKEPMQCIFCMGGTGRRGLVTRNISELIRSEDQDFSVMAGYLPMLSGGAYFLQGAEESSDDVLHGTLTAGEGSRIAERPLACGVLGDSGAPVFMKNKAGPNPDQWFLVGIYTNGDQLDSGYVSNVQIFGDSPTVREFFSKVQKS